MDPSPVSMPSSLTVTRYVKHKEGAGDLHWGPLHLRCTAPWSPCRVDTFGVGCVVLRTKVKRKAYTLSQRICLKIDSAAGPAAAAAAQEYQRGVWKLSANVCIVVAVVNRTSEVLLILPRLLWILMCSHTRTRQGCAR